MRNKNHKNEDYPNFGEQLILEFNSIAKELYDNLHTEGKFINCRDLRELKSLKQKQNLFQSISGKDFNSYNRHDDKKETKQFNDHKGIYVFAKRLENETYEPVYVGISEKLRRRVFGQGRIGNTSNGSFYNLIRRNLLSSNEITNLDNSPIESLFSELRVSIHVSNMDFYNMHMLEIFCAGQLKTYWNSFKPH